jgi:uncharacterized protein YdbL (DUF1318 family)
LTVPTATRRTALVAGLGLAIAALSPWPAGAEELPAAKQAGWLGERIDGYLGVVKADTPPDIRALANEINARRREEYARIAQREGVSVDAVAQLAGQKLIDRAGPGEWVVGADGNWRQK